MCVCVYVCVRETDRETETERHTERQTETEGDREGDRDRETDRQTDRVKHYHDFNHILIILDQLNYHCAPVPLHNNSSNSFRQFVTRKQFNLHTI